MPKEQETPPSRLTLEAVAAIAKESTLRDGHHRFTLLAEGDAQVIAFHLTTVPPTHEQRLLLMLQAGTALAERQELPRLVQAFHISEAWMSTPQPSEPFVPPSQDPDRIEVLMVSQLDVDSNQVALVTYRMRRDDAGTLSALEEMEKRDHMAGDADRLLSAFVAGFRRGLDPPIPPPVSGSA